MPNILRFAMFTVIAAFLVGLADPAAGVHTTKSRASVATIACTTCWTAS